MGIRDFIHSSKEAVKRNVPGLAPVKNGFTTSCNYGSAACSKIGDMFGVERFKQWLPGNEAKSRRIVDVATNVATDVVFSALHQRFRYGPSLFYRLAPGLLGRSYPGLLGRSYPVMDDDEVWISICYPVEYEKSVEGVWNWKYKGNGKGKTTPILVSERISYKELYDIIREELNVDTRLFKMKMSALVPIMRKAPAAPISIECDNDVKWFVSVCSKTFLCITISNEEVENHKEFGDEDVYCQYEVKNSLDIMKSKDKHV